MGTPKIDEKTTIAELKRIVSSLIGGNEIYMIAALSQIREEEFNGSPASQVARFAFKLGTINAIVTRMIAADKEISSGEKTVSAARKDSAPNAVHNKGKK